MIKKGILSVLVLLLAAPLFAQITQQEEEEEEQEEEIAEGWTNGGNFSLMFNQAAFNSEWMSGGTSSLAADLIVDYRITYRKDRLTWVNNFLGEYGLTKQKGENFTRKTSDNLELNSILGYQVEEDSRWFYSFMLDFRTQWGKGYEYDEEQGSRTLTTRFMSPGYLKFGPGMLYKNEDILQVNIAPLTSRFVFVNDQFTTVAGYESESYYGMKPGKSMRYEFGASVDAISVLPLTDNITLNQRLSLFSDYLDKPQNINIDYTLKVDMEINKYLSASVLFQAIYEDKAVSSFQTREMIGIGFSHRL